MGLSEFKLRTKKTSSTPDSYTFKDMRKKDNKNKKKNRSARYVTKGGNGGWEIENRKSSLKRKNDFFLFRLTFYNAEHIFQRSLSISRFSIKNALGQN